MIANYHLLNTNVKLNKRCRFDPKNTESAKFDRFQVCNVTSPIGKKRVDSASTDKTNQSITLSFNSDIKERFTRIVGTGKNKDDYVLTTGNDPVSYAEKYITPVTKLSIVATGGVQCLSNVARLSEEDGGNVSNPLIFLVDHSKPMEEFWTKIGQSFEESEDIASFLSSIPTVYYKKNDLTNVYIDYDKYPSLRGNQLQKVWGIASQSSDEYDKEEHTQRGLDYKKYHTSNLKQYFLELFGNKEEKYQWFKALMKDRFIYLNQCWGQSKGCFEEIKKICDEYDYTIIAYPSNIEQCSIIDLTNKADRKLRGSMLQANIKILSPVLTIKTSQENLTKIEGVIPDTTAYYIDAGKGQSVQQMLAMQSDYQESTALTYKQQFPKKRPFRRLADKAKGKGKFLFV